MAKGDMIIAGSDCEDCRYFEDISDINHKIICKAKDKQYYYGQCITCDCKDKKKGD